MVRGLLGLYVTGVSKYYANARGLSYGQSRFLTIEVLVRAGWPGEAASFIFDISQNVARFLSEHVDTHEDAIDAGLRAGRAHFEDGDVRATMMPEFKLLEWKQAGLWVP